MLSVPQESLHKNTTTLSPFRLTNVSSAMFSLAQQKPMLRAVPERLLPTLVDARQFFPCFSKRCNKTMQFETVLLTVLNLTMVYHYTGNC